MKLFCALFSCLVVSGFATPDGPPEFDPDGSYRLAKTLTTKSANLRDAPSLKGKAVGKLFPTDFYGIKVLEPMESDEDHLATVNTGVWIKVMVEGWLETGGAAGKRIRVEKEAGIVRVSQPVSIRMAEEEGPLAEFSAGVELEYVPKEKIAPNWIFVRKEAWLYVGGGSYYDGRLESKKELPENPGVAEDAAPAKPEGTDISEMTVYKAKSTTTFFGLHKKFGVTVEEIRAVNPDVDENKIKAG